MKNAMQSKDINKNLTKKHISAQLVMQNYILVRLIERISISHYKSNFILKSGFFMRQWLDMDAAIKGFPVNEDTIKRYLSNRYK